MPYTPLHNTSALRYIAIALQCLLGVYFVVSAIAKLLDIDTFEVYVFSLGLLPLNTAMVLCRVLIAIELMLGLMLACGMMPRLAATLSTLLLIFFCMVLCYAIVINRTDSCHCMGEITNIPPALSLLKNSITIVLLLVMLRLPVWQWHPRWYIIMPICITATAAVFCISLPDNWMFAAKSSENYNHELLSHLALPDEPLHDANILEGKKLVVMATERCPYCQRALQKLQAMALRQEIDTTRCIVILPQSNDTTPIHNDGIPMLQGRRYRIDKHDFLHLTNGNRPIVLLLDNGTESASYHYRNINEKEIKQFFEE